MSLLRIAFWVVIVILLIPSGRDHQANTFSIASATMKDLGRFCERNRETCEHGQEMFGHFVDKAKAGGMIVVNFIKDRVSARYANYRDGEFWGKDPSGPEYGRTGSAPQRRWLKQSDHTLTEQDLKPAWLAPGRGADA